MQKTEAARLGENRCLTPLSDNRRLNKEKLDLQHLKHFLLCEKAKKCLFKPSSEEYQICTGYGKF
jgi:hypothetical protein